MSGREATKHYRERPRIQIDCGLAVVPVLSRSEIIELLSVRGKAQEQLFAHARRLRAHRLGQEVVLRGVIEVTNVCRVNCDYCPMRRDNARRNSLFTLASDEIFDAAANIRKAGIDVVFFQGGEVPQTTRLVGEVLPEIRELFSDRVEILLNLGNKTRAEYEYLRAQGATSYILKHETSDPDLHLAIRRETLESRLSCLEDLLELGYKVGTGVIVGIPGQRFESLADDIELVHNLGVHMASASPFVPARSTPFEDRPAAEVDTTLNFIAVTRICNPDVLIPSVSALEKNQPGGQVLGLNAGANVMTINFTPPTRREQYLIYGEHRHIVAVDHAHATIVAAGMRPGRSPFAGTSFGRPQ